MATGRKTVVVGQVIDPVAWGNPLWDQSVQTFASAADRTAQFAAPLKGAVTWLDDVKLLEVYDGVAWRQIPYGSAWTPITVNAGLTVTSGRQFAWRLEAGALHTRAVRITTGAVAIVAGNEYAIADGANLLPAAARPSATVYTPITMYLASNGTPYHARVALAATGGMSWSPGISGTIAALELPDMLFTLAAA